ncbi:TrmB family transcriptional regulator [Halalkalicoccus tibetensis]|uniref:TrmB family transcriptional regulator n=1 Tax=Halalkalicoccus tibetensis TaxID=175632 RepID=A0ABD5VCG0_9EURY
MSPELLTQKATATNDPLPAELDSGNSKLVYLYLSIVEEATVDDLQAALDIQQLTLFPTLRTLEGEDLIERTGETVTIAA